MNFIGLFVEKASSSSPTLFSAVVPGITVALVAGIVLFSLNWAKEGITAWLKRKADAEVLAFSLVTEFDRLVSACAEVVDDPLQRDEQRTLQPTVNSPRIDFPDDWDWRCFPKDLQYRIRSIPNKISLADRMVHDLWWHGDGPPDYDDAFDERILRYAAIGIEAVLINERLAKDYGVPILDTGGWTPKENFRQEIRKVMKRQEAKLKPRVSKAD